MEYYYLCLFLLTLEFLLPVFSVQITQCISIVFIYSIVFSGFLFLHSSPYILLIHYSLKQIRRD